MILRKTPIFTVFVSALFFSSCAALFVPGKQNFQIITGDKQSEVFISGEKEGKGKKVNVKKAKRTGMKEVVVRVPQHKDYHKVIVAEKRDPLFWVFLPFDIATVYPLLSTTFAALPKYFKFDDQISIKNPHAYPVRTEDEKMIKFHSTKVKMEDATKDYSKFLFKYEPDLEAELESVKKERENAQLKEKMKKQKKGNDKETLDNNEENKIDLSDSKFSASMYNTLKKAGYIDTTGNVLINKNNVLGLEAVIVGGEEVRAYYKSLAVSPVVSMLTVKLEMDWLLKNEYNQIIDSIRISEKSDEYLEYYYRYNTASNVDIELSSNAIADAVSNSLLQLFKNEDFKKHLKLDKSEKPVQETITINKPKSIVKNTKDALQSAVIVKNKDGKGHGSGFAISNDGYVLTNFHVVAGRKAGDYKDVVAVLPNGSEADLEVVRVDPTNDLALLKVNAKFNKAFLLTDVKKYDLLDQVFTVGAPASVDLGNTLTTGVLSSERKSDGIDKIQLNMSVSPGNSGGPVFDNETGVLHGVISSKIVGNNTEGIAFAVPSHNIMKNMYLEVK